jgi:hypothetical protein
LQLTNYPAHYPLEFFCTPPYEEEMTDLQDPDEAVGTIKRLKRQVLKSKENLNDIIELKEYTKV